MPETSHFRKQLAHEGREAAGDTHTSGLIGYVVNFHPAADICNCSRHKGAKIEKDVWHTADIDVFMGRKYQRYVDVPCFVYSQGILDHGLKPNDRVWVEFIGGDKSHAVITAYYRDPSGLEVLVNDFQIGVANFVSKLFNW
ncbi:hypothetical protein [Alicyclobacillus shizuokensis]|uniref:hypothetical protein n=1 Tax=Alicyclobacillus shizuokensis TaxID=392014 RepID=UPI000AC0FE67|nr:hypothetical protein [Alicyclobacillus shizuokensis]